VETVISLAAIVALVGVLSAAAGRLITRKGAMWVWDHSSIIGWILIVLGVGFIVFGFADPNGNSMSVKLGFGSLLLLAGLWMIW
jgi:hypothetical protein